MWIISKPDRRHFGSVFLCCTLGKNLINWKGSGNYWQSYEASKIWPIFWHVNITQLKNWQNDKFWCSEGFIAISEMQTGFYIDGLIIIYSTIPYFSSGAKGYIIACKLDVWILSENYLHIFWTTEVAFTIIQSRHSNFLLSRQTQFLLNMHAYCINSISILFVQT